MRKVVESLVVFALFSLVVFISVRLQGPFSMEGPVAVVVLGAAFLIAFLRFIVFRQRTAVWFYAAVLLVTLWYPFAFTATGSAYTNGPGLSDLRFYVNFLLSLRIEAVYRPLLMLLGASVAGGALGYSFGRLFRRLPKPQPA
jgi:hypothetical protein